MKLDHINIGSEEKAPAKDLLTNDWFTINQIDMNTYIISEYRHWDHIGGHKYFTDFYVHETEENWLDNEFPLTLDVDSEILIRIRDTFRKLKEEGKLHHGSGKVNYDDWGVWL